MEFYKMHGCGNDFVVMDYVDDMDASLLAQKVCAAKTGVGADGLILVKKDPLEMIFYNRDGTRASMCGNGIRCFARYVYEKGYVQKKKFDVLTLAGIMQVEIVSLDSFSARVGMGTPSYQNGVMHLADNIDSFGRLLTIESYRLTIYSMMMGTIHTVLFVDDMNSHLLTLAKNISTHPLFKAMTNVDFVHVIDENNIEMKTYERGVGWTLACGTGACSAAVTAHRLGLVHSKVQVHLPKGNLEIEVDKKERVFMTGPAVITFTGDLKEDGLC